MLTKLIGSLWPMVLFPSRFQKRRKTRTSVGESGTPAERLGGSQPALKNSAKELSSNNSFRAEVAADPYGLTIRPSRHSFAARPIQVLGFKSDIAASHSRRHPSHAACALCRAR